jgi:hypothetical protein
MAKKGRERPPYPSLRESLRKALRAHLARFVFAFRDDALILRQSKEGAAQLHGM